MPLRGNLVNLRLGDVLQTVLTSGGNGVLRVRSGTRRAVLHFADRGLRVLEPEILDDKMLLDAFVRRGAIAQDVYERARRLAGKGGDASVLETLLIGGSIDRAPFDALLHEAAEDAVLDVLSWTEGDFVFDDEAGPSGAPPASGRVAEVVLDPNGILLRAAQRIDEEAAVRERLGEHALLLLPVETPHPRATGTATAVLSRLDGVRLLDEIALEAGLPFFEARKAAAALVEAGAARLPTPHELEAAAAQRDQEGDARAVGGLLRQWAALCPDDPAPIEAALALATRLQRAEDETSALRALGQVHLRSRRAAEAHEAFDRLERKRPGDREALDGKRQAAQALGDLDEFARVTRAVAVADLEADDAPHAADVLAELLAVRPDDIDARRLRTKALTRAGRRDEAVAEFGRLADALPKRCTRRTDRDAASYARSTIAHLAPDETVLLSRFQRMLEAKGLSRRGVAILAALLLVLGGVGFVLWPASPAALLSRAQAAASRGELSTALELLDTLEAKHPDAAEAAHAADLRRRWVPTPAATASGPSKADLAPLLASAASAAEALPRWPALDAVAPTEALVAALRAAGAEGMAARRVVADRVGPGLLEAVGTLRGDAQRRLDALDAVVNVARMTTPSVDVLGNVLARARAATDPAWPAAASRAAEAARRLAALLDNTSAPASLPDDIRGLEADITSATRAMTHRAEDLARLQREHHRLTVLSAYESARTDGARRLARGDLTSARAEVARLRELITTTEQTPALRPVLEGLEKRGVLEFVAARETMWKAIDEGLSAALEAERTGNLAGASSQYARLVRQFPHIRFDDTFTVPLKVEVVPPTAAVSLNGRAVDRDGTGTSIVRYGWGSSATLSVSAPGFTPTSVVLDTASERPRAEITVRLIPERKWSAPLPGTVEATPYATPGGVVVATRSGRVECRGVSDGVVRWTVETRCVEGVRGRSVSVGDTLFVPLLDGRVARILMSTGGTLPPLQLRERPVGDAASSGQRVAIAMEGALAVFSEGDTPAYVTLPASTTAGVLAAHGAFWVGDATGGVTRVDAASLISRTVRPGGSASVVGLATDDRRIYALTEDGTLHALGGSAQETVWSRAGLGEVSGSPAAAGGVVAVAQQGGRIVLLASADGSPLGVRETGSPARGGLASSGARVVAALSDGRLWVYDASKDSVVVDAPLEGTARIPPAVLEDHVVAPAAGNGVALLPLPR